LSKNCSRVMAKVGLLRKGNVSRSVRGPTAPGLLPFSLLKPL